METEWGIYKTPISRDSDTLYKVYKEINILHDFGLDYADGFAEIDSKSKIVGFVPDDKSNLFEWAEDLLDHLNDLRDDYRNN